MATDPGRAAKILNQIRREWGVDADETTAQAQALALTPLHEWLSTGTAAPEVILRSTQVLLANPEIPGIDQRHSLDTVSQQIASVWARAGQGHQGILGLQAMLLAAWPYEATQGGFALTPMLDSAWLVAAGRERYRPRINDWRQSILQQHPKAQRPSAPQASLQSSSVQPVPLWTLSIEPQMAHLRTNAKWDFYSDFGIQLTSVLDAQTKDLNTLATFAFQTRKEASNASTALNEIQANISKTLQDSQSEIDLLWWGHARYSHTLLTPFRRIKKPSERLWWMAWESSQFAMSLAVEPSASFLAETLLATGDNINERRPLKEWVRELVSTLRETKNQPKISKKLEDIASKDSLGLPVTWARIEALNQVHHEASIEDRATIETGLNLNYEIDCGEWAAWVFREALLDRHLGAL